MPTDLTHRPSTDGPRAHHPWLLPMLVILPVIAILVTAVVLTHSPVRSGSVAASARPHTVRYQVTGVPGARFSISYAHDDATSQVVDQPLPWSTEATVRPTRAPFVEVTVKAVRGAAVTPPTTATTDCLIVADGHVVAENHTSAQSAYVDCDAVLP